MKVFSITILFTIIALTSCSQPKTPEEWMQKHSIELKQDSTYDFSKLKSIIGDKRIVAIGESSHGLGEFYRLKSELVIYLHEELGFEIIAMEGGLGDINLAYSNVDTMLADQLRDNTLFGNFRAKEANALFQYIKKTNHSIKPLVYAGYDTQSSSRYSKKLLQNIMINYNKPLSDSLQNRLYSYYTMAQAQDSINFYKHRNIFMETSEEVKDLLKLNQAEIIADFNLTKFQFDILIKTLEGYKSSVNFPYEKRYGLIALRDKIMAENIEWLLNDVYPNKKMIIWGHNGHIENTNVMDYSGKMMGHFLKEKYTKDYYAIGLFAYKGETYQHWTKTYIKFENSDTSYLERRMINSGKKVTFLNLDDIKDNVNTQWAFSPIKAYEVESNGEVSFVPKSRFDALITVYESRPPTFIE